MAGVNEGQDLAGQGGEGLLDLEVGDGGAAQAVGIGIPGQVVIVAVGIVHAMAGDKDHGDVPAGDLGAQPIQSIEQFLAGGILQAANLHLAIQPPRLTSEGRAEVPGVLGGELQVQAVVLVIRNPRQQGIKLGLGDEIFRLAAFPVQPDRFWG